MHLTRKTKARQATVKGSLANAEPIRIGAISRHILQGLLKIALKNRRNRLGPFTLSNIYVDCPRSTMVASDGMTLLLAAQSLNTNCAPFLLPRAACEQVVNLTSVKKPEVMISLRRRDQNGLREIELATSKKRIRTLEGEGPYLPYRTYIPLVSSGVLAHFDPRHLLRLYEAFALITPEHSECLHVLHNGGRPALVVSKDSGVFGLVNPLSCCDMGREAAEAVLAHFGFAPARPPIDV